MIYFLIVLISINTPLKTKSLVEIRTDRGYFPELVAAGFEIDHFKDGVAKGLIDYDRVDDLRNYGYEVKVLYKDYQEETRWILDIPDRGHYHTYSEFLAAFDSLVNDYPDITLLDTIGYSVQNRLIIAMKISDNPDVEEAEPTFIFDGDIHGDELIAGEVVLAQAKEMCYEYGSDTLVTRLVDECETWLVPMVNPDGVVAVRRYNANWVDLNRDFGYQWDGSGNSPGPFSQVETKARRDIFFNNYSVNTIDFHSGTELYIYPWGFTTMATPDSTRNDYIADRYTDYFPVPYGQISRVLYEVWGGCTDFYYGCYGDLAPAVELSYNKIPPESQIDPISNMNVQGMLDLMRISLYGIRGIVTDSVTGAPLAARVEIENAGWQVYADPQVGDYYHFLLSGTYDVTARANGYYSKTVSGVVVPSNGYTEVDFDLVPEDGQKYGAFAVPSSRVRQEPSPPGDLYFTLKLLGPADNISLRLGSRGWVVLDMGPDSPIINEGGDDLTVVTTTTGQTYDVSVADTIDGNFVDIGSASQTQSFDIGSSGYPEARYVRIDARSYNYPAVDAVESYMPVWVADEEMHEKIVRFRMIQNPSRRIQFVISANASYSVEIYDCQGRLMTKDVVKPRLKWTNYRSPQLPSGVYFLKVEGKNFSTTEKCLIIRR